MSTEPGKLIGTRLSFQVNHVSTMMTGYVLDSMPVNAAFHSALSNDILAEHPGLWFGVQFRNRYVHDVLQPKDGLFL